MDAKQAQKILLDEQKSLTDLRQQSKEARAPVELDQQAVGRLSRMDALQKQNMELATEQRRQRRRAEGELRGAARAGPDPDPGNEARPSPGL